MPSSSPRATAPTVLEVRGVVEAIHRSQAVLEFGLDGTVLTANANALAALGYELDEVRGVTHLASAALVAARAHGERLLFSHTFRHPDTGRAHSVLDASALLSLPGVPTVDDVTRQTTAAGRFGSGTTTTLTIVRCGDHRFAIDAAHVHTTLPTPDLRPSVLSSRTCRGVLTFAEREVPVVDPLALLGLGELSEADMGAGLVLDLGAGYVVLALSALLELAEVPASDVLPLPSHAVPRPELLTGMAEIEGIGDCLVLSGEALLADPRLAGFASVNTALSTGTASGDAAAEVAAATAQGAPSYLTFSIGVDVTVPLDQVMEIVPFPDALTDTAVDGVLGVIVHRRSAVPVFCLSALLGREQRPPTATSCLLLVDVDGEAAAFAVEALRSIDPLTWRDEGQQLRGTAEERGATLRTAPLVRVGANDRLLPDMDLRAVMRRTVGQRGAAAERELIAVG